LDCCILCPFGEFVSTMFRILMRSHYTSLLTRGGVCIELRGRLLLVFIFFIILLVDVGVRDERNTKNEDGVILRVGSWSWSSMNKMRVSFILFCDKSLALYQEAFAKA
jgi:hypothetical protein